MLLFQKYLFLTTKNTTRNKKSQISKNDLFQITLDLNLGPRLEKALKKENIDRKKPDYNQWVLALGHSVKYGTNLRDLVEILGLISN